MTRTFITHRSLLTAFAPNHQPLPTNQSSHKNRVDSLPNPVGLGSRMTHSTINHQPLTTNHQALPTSLSSFVYRAKPVLSSNHQPLPTIYYIPPEMLITTNHQPQPTSLSSFVYRAKPVLSSNFPVDKKSIPNVYTI